MKKILYISNIEVPYRVRFFNELSKKCDLTVIYERSKSSNRDSSWIQSEECKYNKIFLDGIKIGNEFSFSLKLFKYILRKYDEIIFGCFNSPLQIIFTTFLRIINKKYCMSFDGELFIETKGFKNRLKQFFIKGAHLYFAAGEKSAETIRRFVPGKKVIPYYFSSLTKKELDNNKEKYNTDKCCNGQVLVVGQYFDYKGLDIAVKVADINHNINYLFVGMGKRTKQFIQDLSIEKKSNIKVVDFMTKSQLEKEYLESAVLLLPSRRECWGLVVNEAASYGLPIVSTFGSGAAVEILSDCMPECIVSTESPQEMYRAISEVIGKPKDKYSNVLFNQNYRYTIDKMVEIFSLSLKL